MAVKQPPVPGSLTINGKAEADGLSTHDSGSIAIRAKIRDHPKKAGQVRLVVRWSTNSQMSGGGTIRSPWGGERAVAVNLVGTGKNTRYYLRVYCEQKNLPQLSDFNSTNFWTERYPLNPTLVAPPTNATIVQGNAAVLQWTHRDPDVPADKQSRAQIQIRVPANSMAPAGPTTTYTSLSSAASYSVPASSLNANTFYEWRVRTSDVHTPATYGPWSEYRSFFVLGSSLSPILQYPINNEAIAVDRDFAFLWRFRDPSGDLQSKADLRYRVAGTEDWTTLTGDVDPGIPGSAQAWPIAGGTSTLQPGYRYEWQVRTVDNSGLGVPSDWSTSAFFYAIVTPGTQGDDDWLGPTVVQGSLGNGEYRVMVFERGGNKLVGEIKPIRVLRWNRVRDDMSTALIETNGFGADCCEMLSNLECWAYEIVLFRNGQRVWEGPITRIGFFEDHVEIEARDVLAYVYRRIMRQGYNDNYRVVGGVKGHAHTFNYPSGRPPGYCVCGAIEWGIRTVVDRAAIIIGNALAPNDPNVLPWLTRFDFPDDAQEARQVPDWSKTAFEEVDNLAATGGLDYTVVGRRIVLFDTHRPIGLLAEMRGKDFFNSPVLTQYGMNAANIFGVTNNAGLWGSYEVPRDQWGNLGPIEMLASEYGEASTGGAPETLTPAQQAQKRAILAGQARRNISGRWPAPFVVRVPDNSRVNPKANVGINQLVPGVHIPLRVKNVCRDFAQVQKLDSLNVEVLGADENVRVTMSPAPSAGVDPDAEGGGEEMFA